MGKKKCVLLLTAVTYAAQCDYTLLCSLLRPYSQPSQVFTVFGLKQLAWGSGYVLLSLVVSMSMHVDISVYRQGTSVHTYTSDSSDLYIP